ncbi:iron-sulfur cluster-binding protein [Pontibacter sp. BT310]|jgi:L-lactate dehydrogenase complex protein LldF|uniref:Iron-sulfur cluster-binding protein n=1 Tax=Pontibacter populi TaxID=890055 RepID=A0ABS6X9M6_9BACT|nr:MULTISPECIES: LutB/LldF family L-lactate oxidation iron-sulfur protein [Pontibacter]MBJ6117805.1 iron-sulfur cluster-binding protein [Pontibacter sp. BT310]MBR0570231.1 iron-sulfur cluster-binding protein [Microvirga sp. STS03]MBW3364657.1 iron-sulfur cluster-binding protein [Pontibacter populi]
MSKLKQFLIDSETKSFDQNHRATIRFNIGKYNAAVQRGLTQYSDHELARERASYIKTNTIKDLDKYLMEFEANFTARGGKVIWARDAQEALKEIGEIMKRKRAKSVVKSKSMITEEIHMNEFLEKNGVEVVETDLGEYIVQLAEQRPYHIVTPAMHMSKKDIAELFVRKLNIAPTDDAQELVGVARRLLRDKYTSAEIGITGGNFLLADVGGVAVTENEGNARLSTTFPKTHIAIVGIEKMLPSIMDLDLFWPLLSTSGTGQNVTVYNTIFTGPRQPNEKDGPEEMYVILLDNGRTELMSHPEKREALNCIRCGACLNICPVYKNIGGHTYESTYSGPIGSVLTPHFNGMAENKHLSFASSLCGACTSVCPVKINIHNLLLLNRKQSVDMGLADKQEKTAFKFWLKAMKSRKLMNMAPSGIKNYVVKYILKDTWSKRREPMKIAPKSFNQLWKERS